MAWTAEKVKAMRESNPAKTAQSDGWTAEKVRAMRTKTPTATTEKTSAAKAAEAANRYAVAFEGYQLKNQNAPQAPSRNVLTDTASGAKAYGTSLAQQFKAGTDALERKSDRLDALNQWYDDPHNQQLVADVTAKKNDFTTYAERGTSWNADSAPAPLALMGNSNYGLLTAQPSEAKYTDEQLKKRGYSANEIGQARQYLKEINEIPEAKQLGRRLANTAGGIADTVEAAPFLAGEYAVQAGKNLVQSAANRKALEAEVAQSPREKHLYEALLETDMDYQPKYSVDDLLQQGFTRDEIDNMKARIAGTEAQGSIDKEQSLGYQIYNRGQKLNAAAQSGLSPAAKAAHGIVSSAAENLVVGSVNPAAVLPVLSAQGAAEAMGQSVEKNESAGKALAGGLAKFGAGWAINSVGAADLARSMGSDYAKDTMAGQIADWVRGLAGDGALAQNYPAVANAISGGMDNAMQAFVETYADQAIDAALGDEEAAQTMFDKDTFLSALESGLSGGASGALGGAVGTGLGAMRARAAERAQAQAGASSQTADAASSPKGGALGKEGNFVQTTVSSAEDAKAVLSEKAALAEETSVNDDPATHTAAQNTSIAKYKDSVDPKLAEYVDRVRAGEKLEPYMVTETSDRMRSAMMELTGLEKVGDRTLMDANAVQHITNRHAGGDGSADGTMKNSADVARAAYVLNNFDHAYLAKDRAKGYKDSRGKRAPIVLFEKKIDGTHIVVEAVMDTKKSTNYIVSEYLSKNGVDEKEIAKRLQLNAAPLAVTETQQAPMDAASDPRHTSETFSAHSPATTEELQASMNAASSPRDTSETLADLPSAEISITADPREVNRSGVENAGETVEKSYADEVLQVDEGQMNTADWDSEQKQAARQLARNARMSTQAAQTVVDNMPSDVGAGVYVQAANSLYRLGVSGVESFEKALDLSGPMSWGGATRQVMSLGQRGENALHIAFLQGKGEADSYHAKAVQELGKRPGPEALRADAGTYYKNGDTPSKGSNGMDAFIELGAKATGTTVRRVLDGIHSNAKGCIKTATSEMYLSGRADVETVMHETLHELNSWSAETGQEYIDTLMKYLVQANGMESTDALVRSYLARYEEAGKKLTYNEAAEEIAADSVRAVFGDAEGFRNFVRQQAYEAEANARARGTIDRVMGKIKSLLETVLRDVKTLLGKEPTNAAAKAAQNLTKEQLHDLQMLYFEHQRQAGENYRAALEANKNAPAEAKTTADEAGEVKYQIDDGFEKAIDELDINSKASYEVHVGTTSEVLKSIGVKDREIIWHSGKIRKILAKHSAENFRTGADHSIMTKEILKQVPQVLEHPILVVHSDTTQNADYASRIFMYGDVKDTTGKPVNVSLELLPTDRKGLAMENIVVLSAYGHNRYRPGRVLQGEVLYADPDTKRTSSWLRDNRLQLPFALTSAGPKAILRYNEDNVKAVMVEPLQGQRKYYLKAITAEQAQKLYPTKKEDTSTSLPKAMLSSAEGTRDVSSNTNIAQENVNFKADDTKYQLDVDPEDVESVKAAALGDVEQQTETIRQAVEAGGKVRLSDQSVNSIAKAVLSDVGSKMSAKTLAERIRAMSDYIALSKEVSWEDVYSFASDMAEQVMSKSTKRNDELWRQYPELHKMSMKIEKGSKDYREIVYRWGSWANARKELARHGVNITQTQAGEHSRWDADFAELQKLGAGLLPSETPTSAADALDAMAAAHDTIRPVMESIYDEDWNGSRQDIAMQLMLRYLNSPEVASKENAQYRKEFTAQWEKMRQQAKQEALEARAKVFAEQAQFAQELKSAKAEAAKANAGREAAEMREDAVADRAKQLREKQRTEMNVRLQLMKNKAAQQLQKARDAREMDTARRSIRAMTSQLTQMCEKPTEKSHVSEYLVDKVRPVAMVANDAIGNHEAAARIRAGINNVYGPLPENVTVESAMEGLRRGVAKEVSRSERAAMEWEQSGITDKIDSWLSDVNERRQIEMEKLRGEIENAEKWLTKDTPEKKAYLDRLHNDLKAYEDGSLATLSAEQVRGLSEILEQTLYIVKNENVMLGSIEDVMIDDFAEGVHGELEETAKNQKDDTAHKVLREVGSVYKLNTMNIERNFERLGGYRHGGFMEQLGQQLNHGQFRKERITAEGERIFENVTGPKHAEELYHFTHDLVDIGLKTADGKPWLVTHDVMAELWVQLQNRQGMHHLLYGGATIADMSLSTKGMKGLGEQYAETVTLGELVTTDENGNKLNAYEISQREDTLRTSIIGEIEKNLTAYDDQWIADFKKLGKMTKGYVNETSMALFGVKIARVDNYIRLHVDKNTIAEQNEGIRRDVSVGSEGFTKNRQNSAKPLELVGLVRQAAESIENTAQYAGMAIPLRNAEKVLNTMKGGKTLYGQIERVWGRAGRSYMTKAMADLSGSSKSGSEVFDRLSGKLRGAAAAAVLTGNLNVTLLQAASLPTAAAELGWGSTGHAAVQFAANLRPSQLNAIVERAYRFGDALLPTRLRGSSRGELSSAAKEQGVGSVLHDGARNSSNAVLRYGTRAVDKLADFAGGSIGWMDKVTVASLFHGAESYVQHHLTEYDLTKADLPTKAQEDGTKAYQNAVMSKFQRVVERTQPNYTAMQRTGMQRSKNQMLKTVTMFSTQRQQNAQIMVSAMEDLRAQLRRNDAAQNALKAAKAANDVPRLAECKTEAEKAADELKTAKGRMFDAISSQIMQTAVIAGLGIFVKFALHRWDDLQDENGDMTLASLGGSFLYQFFNSGVSNYTGGSELWTAAETIRSKKLFGTYDSVSMTGFSALNDAVKSITKLNALLDKGTDEMTEEELDAYTEKVKQAWADAAGQLMMLQGVPYNNGKKYVQAVFAWMDTAKQWSETGERNFNSVPSSATGQYDRLYNAIQNGDGEEAQAALDKLNQMGKDDKTITSQLKTRLKKYSPEVEEAAEARNAGDDAKRQKLTKQLIREMYSTLGIRENVKADAAKREQVIDLVTGAINQKAEELYKGGTDGSVYDDLTEALDSGRAKDVQDELDRLLTAGKEASSIKNKITNTVKDEYLAGNDRDREQLEAMLLKLTDGDGKTLYEKKNFEQWVKQAKKKEEKDAGSTDEWAGLR